MKSARQSYRPKVLGFLLFLGYWFLSTFEGYISGSIGAVSKYYILLLIFFLLVTAKKLSITSSQIAIAMWAIYYMTSLFWSPNPQQGMLYVFSVMGMVVLLLLIMGLHFEKQFVNQCIHMTTIFSLFLGFLGLFFSQQYYGEIESRRVLTLLGVQLDPNNLIALYASGVGLGLYFFLFGADLKPIARVIYGVGACVNFYDILMCGSRTGVIVLSFLVFILLFFQPGETSKVKKIINRFFIIILIILVAIILVSYLPPEVWERISGQDQNLRFWDSAGRIERWMTGLSIWWDTNFLFGCGWGAFECHGTFFTFLVDTGLVGMTLLGFSLAQIGFTCIRTRQTQALLIMASGILPAFFIGAQNRRFFWNAIILPVMIINEYRENKNESNSFIGGMESKN